MCSQFQLHGIENYDGDLADIVRAGGGGGLTGTAASPAVLDTWQYPEISNDDNNGTSTSNGGMAAAAAVMNCYPSDHHDFGDPFCDIRDPMIFQELAMPPRPPAGAAAFFSCSEDDLELDLVDPTTAAVAGETAGTSTSTSIFAPPPPKLVLDEQMKRPTCNIFSRMLQISPNSNLNPPPPPQTAVAGGGGGLAAGNENIISVNNNNNNNNTANNAAGLQISSPGNTGTIKRRKSQAKKVVCVPAPAPANSRPSGEVVPSDLWAWRKYGQKPIKGSPYPRGYYRCSSSKGCSARKQVERSRTDPNMLVITYTSEHNHPWPTQRNALAGSTRSQPSKTTATASASNAATPKSPNSQTPTSTTTNNKDTLTHHHTMLSDSMSPTVKEEAVGTTAEEDRDGGGGMMQMNHLDEFGSYRPAMPVDNNHNHNNNTEDFFADLGEIETTDPLNLMFSGGGTGSGSGQGFQDKKAAAISAMDDAFSFYDWTSTTDNNNNNS